LGIDQTHALVSCKTNLLTKFSCGTWELIKHALVSCKTNPLYHHFYPQLVHAHSEQYHHTNNLLVLHMTSYH